ncbi:hypothetical protein [Aeromicrobium sp. 9AM]|uniref:hypothetical protein n=1 Tax=Aeromicrobium sp. 9AM TaxID=2653126 RepID=UPI0012F0EFA3|nr:hypothetical protein [Aeromicrobium sp. 9AM]VXB90424.1 membrane hypothetical protein [Aeromicrobium sp. 9AM]
MTFRRGAALAAALALVARFLITDSAWTDTFVAAAFAVGSGIAITLAFRARQASSSELIFTWTSAVLYAAGGTYLDHWSGEGDIGGVVPYMLGLPGMLVVAVALSLPVSRQTSGV